MTEIKIEKKKPVLIWVILAIVALAVLLYLYFSSGFGKDEKVGEDLVTIEQTTTPVKNATVDDYVSFVNDDANKMGLDHDYTNSALLKLADAIEAKSNDVDFDVKADISRARELSDKITTDPFETTHANSISKAADIFSTSLVNLQRAKFPSLTAEAADVQSSAAAINPELLTLDQKDAVKSFFGKAADLLNRMN